jgi:hypothetical protein
MSSSYGIAGSSPFADYASRINVLLCDAIKARWNQDVHGDIIPPIPYPSAADDIIWLNTWYTGSRDIELIFKEEFDDTPVQLRTTDWRYQGHITTVNLHIFVRGVGGDVEPAILGQVIRGLEKVVALNRTSLILNGWCEVISTQPGPTERSDSNQTLWHVLMKIRVYYYKVKTV